MLRRTCFAIGLIIAAHAAWSVHARADDIYTIDPILAKISRSAQAPLTPAGGRLDIPASDGVAAQLWYPSNDACAGSTIRADAVGPAGLARMTYLDTVYHAGKTGWQPFYVLTIAVNDACTNKWLTFAGFPHITLNIPSARPGTIYYADVAVESGNSTHIPLGPPDERDSKHVDFDLNMLPMWAQRDGDVSVPTGYTIRVIVARQ